MEYESRVCECMYKWCGLQGYVLDTCPFLLFRCGTCIQGTSWIQPGDVPGMSPDDHRSYYKTGRTTAADVKSTKWFLYPVVFFFPLITLNKSTAVSYEAVRKSVQHWYYCCNIIPGTRCIRVSACYMHVPYMSFAHRMLLQYRLSGHPFSWKKKIVHFFLMFHHPITAARGVRGCGRSTLPCPPSSICCYVTFPPVKSEDGWNH